MTLQERADLYRKAFPKATPLFVYLMNNGKETIEGQFKIGNSYKGSGYRDFKTIIKK